jgi:hypothetical protein
MTRIYRLSQKNQKTTKGSILLTWDNLAVGLGMVRPDKGHYGLNDKAVRCGFTRKMVWSSAVWLDANDADMARAHGLNHGFQSTG